VIDINLIYTTLKEPTPEGDTASVLQIPNSLFFQRTLRRWRGAPTTPVRAGNHNEEAPRARP
jgi:hypothetical protein